MRKAFISVSDKTGLETLATVLTQFNIQMIASEGSAQFLASRGFSVQSVTDYLQASPILDGRVKTLHSGLFGGILADRQNAQHLYELEQLSASLIDFVSGHQTH